MSKLLLTLIALTALSYQVLSSRIDDKLCDKQLKHFDSALEEREHWALYVFDTWGKFQSSILRGNNLNPGGFSDCVNFRHDTNDTEVGEIQGQHCMINFKSANDLEEIDDQSSFQLTEIGHIIAKYELDFRHGICVPSSCSSQKSLEYANRYLSEANLLGTAARCQTNDPLPFEAMDIVTIIIFSSIGLLMVLSTIYEVSKIRNNHEVNELYAAFSVYTTGKKLFDVRRAKSINSIDCLHGLRALSVLYIIWGHRVGIALSTGLVNLTAFREWYFELTSAVFNTHQVAVDTFLFMGGLLLAWTMLPNLERGTVKLWRMYLHRYLRYTPALLACLLFTFSIQKFFRFGPLTDQHNYQSQENCHKWWWGVFLHIQNYMNPEEFCLDQSWYLAVDFQLFLISPLLLYPAWKYGWKFVWVLPGLTVASAIYIFIISYQLEIRCMAKNPQGVLDLFRYVYYPTHARMGPWFMGMTLGYVLHKTRGTKIRINPIANAIMWILCISTFIAITLGAMRMFRHGIYNVATQLENSFYLSLYRNGWSVALFWLVFACHNGTGGIIRWFLSLPQWQPIGRMCLSMYLVGWMYQIIAIGNYKLPIYFEEIEWIHMYWGDIFGTMILGTLLYLTCEVPFLKIESYLFRKYNEGDRKPIVEGKLET